MPFTRRGGPRQRKVWKGMGTAIIQTSSTNVTGLVANPLSDTLPFTVLRMIGEYWIAPFGVNTLNDACVWTLGIGVVSEDAATLGGTAMPDPEDEPDYPWLFWAQHFMRQSIAAEETGGDPTMALRRSYDIRSMRKIKPRETVAMIFQFRDVNGAPSYSLMWGVTRVLVGL